MRPNPFLSLVLVLATGCTESDDTGSDVIGGADYTLDVFGSFERLTPGDPQSPWKGSEYTQISDRDGVRVCQDGFDLVGAILEQDETGLTLEVTRAEAIDLRPSCDVGFDGEQGLISGIGYLTFDLETSRFGEQRGAVSWSQDGMTWTPYASGLLLDDSLVYHHSSPIAAEPDAASAVRTDWVPKDPQEPPIQ